MRPEVPSWVSVAGAADVISEPWLGASELRIGLGCMRLSTERERDGELALETIAAAADAGATVVDTARPCGAVVRDVGAGAPVPARSPRGAGRDPRARARSQ